MALTITVIVIATALRSYAAIGGLYAKLGVKQGHLLAISGRPLVRAKSLGE